MAQYAQKALRYFVALACTLNGKHPRGYTCHGPLGALAQGCWARRLQIYPLKSLLGSASGVNSLFTTALHALLNVPGGLSIGGRSRLSSTLLFHLCFIPFLRRHLMKNSHRKSRTFIATLAAIPLAVSQAFAVELVVWDGPAAGGNYETAANWDPNVVPVNGADTYTVIIGSNGGNPNVNYSRTGSNSITNLDLQGNATLAISEASVFTSVSLSVNEVALISGDINATGGDFTAVGAGSGLVGDHVRVLASNGGKVAIAGANYSPTGLSGSFDILSATLSFR